MEITVISTETIKPSSPTPRHLQHLQLSLIDQYMTGTVYTHVILFYSAQGDVHRFRTTNMSDRLKKSLSEVLTEFYPLAGKFSNNQSIHCNDEGGLDYVEARVKAPYTLAGLVNSPQSEELNRLLVYDPSNYGTDFDGKLSAVQVTTFDDCGGMAIGVSVSHTIADGSSLAMFVKTWAAVLAREDAPRTPNDYNTPSPKFGFASLFPPRDDIPVLQLSNLVEETERPQPKLITKRFVFDQMNINALKANFHASQCPPSRVEAVSALLFKCLINVARSRSPKSIALTMGVNLRSRMTPPVSMHHFGNMAFPLTIENGGLDSVNDLGVQIRKSVKEVDSDYLEKLQADNGLLLFETFKERMKLFANSDVRVFGLTSFCRFPFSEIDVGWGEPVWTASFFPNCPDSVMLVDATNGGGIEAWVTLHEDDMERFESDGALLEFTGSVP